MRRTTKLLVAALLILPLIGLAVLDPAVAGSTQTGTMRGKVVDQKGQPLPGAMVTLRSAALIRERPIVTDAEGNFFAPALPRGTYEVIVTFPGYMSIVSDTEVEIDQTTVLPPVTMREGEIKETVTVTATKPVVDKTSVAQAVEVPRTFYQNLPAPRAYQSLVDFAPGVAGQRGDNPSILGGTANSNVYLVDGISTRDPVTGTFGVNFTFDVIEAVDVKLTGISAEYGEHQGGIVNLITRSGGNEFTGSFRDQIRAPSWTKLYSTKSQDEFAPPTSFYSPPGIPQRSPDDANKTHRVSATFGGPIVTDHAWFFVGYDRIESGFSDTLGNPTGGPYGNGTYIDFFDGDIPLGKATWQVSNNHKVAYQYLRDPARTPICYGKNFFGGPCYEDYNVDLQKQGGFSWIGSWDAVWGANVTTNVKVARFKNGFNITPLAPVPVRPGLPLSGTGDVGFAIDLTNFATYDANIFASVPEDREREQYEASTTMFLDTKGMGSHTVKVGLDYRELTRVGASILQGNAYFLFDFANQPPGMGGNGNPYDINNRSYYVWYDFAPPTEAGPVNKLTTVYVNDDWQLGKHWSFNLGLRYEQSLNENDVGEKIIDDSGFAPRLGANFDILGDGKNIVKASAARYLAGINLTTLSPFVRAAGGQSSYDVYVNTDFPVPGVPNWLLVAQVRPTSGAATFAPGIKPQRIDEYTLGYEHLFTPTIGMKVRAVDRKWADIITQRFTYDYTTGVPIKIFKIDNSDDAERKYRAAILEVEKRLSHNWEMVANYTYSKTEGNVTTDTGFDSYDNYAGVPQVTENRYGYLPWDATHQFKLQGFYNIPLKSERNSLSVGAIYDYRSGGTYGKNNTVVVDVGPGPNGVQDYELGTLASAGIGDDQSASLTEYYEERGSRRTPANQRLDLVLRHNFMFNNRIGFETRFEVFNVTDEQMPLAYPISVRTSWVDGGTAAQNHTFGYPTGYTQFQTPRRYEVQFALMW